MDGNIDSACTGIGGGKMGKAAFIGAACFDEAEGVIRRIIGKSYSASTTIPAQAGIAVIFAGVNLPDVGSPTPRW